MRKKSTLYLTRGALVTALYVALTYLATLFGLSSGVIQFRFSEALCVLPIFMPEAVLGLTVGCLLSNIISGCVIWDIIFGTLATLIGAITFANEFMHSEGISITLLTFGPRQFILMFAVSVAVAAISSFLPVYRIARRKPIDAIRDK